MNPKDKLDHIMVTDDILGQKYSCAICGFTTSRLEIRCKGWGKSQKLRKIIRDHIKESHRVNKNET